MRKYLTFLYFLLTIANSSMIHSQTEDTRTRINFQIAGNIGHISLGWGSNVLLDQLMVDFHYGYYHHSQTKMQVNTLALKTSFQYFKLEKNNFLLQTYIGTTLSYSIVYNTFLRYPSYFPTSYYDFPNAIHVLPYLGIMYKLNKFPLGIYIEPGSSDYLIIAAFRNKSIKPHQTINLAFGLRFFL